MILALSTSRLFGAQPTKEVRLQGSAVKMGDKESS
jgi:hypothetical protein